MKYMNWNNEDLASAPSEQVREIIKMMNEEAERIAQIQAQADL